MDKFRRIMDGGYLGFQTGDARQIIRDSSEVTHYIESKREHLAYVQQLMNDKIIDEAMGRVRDKGDFEYDGDGAFAYRPGIYHNINYPRQILAEQYPVSNVYPQQMTPQQYGQMRQSYPNNTPYSLPPHSNAQSDSVIARIEAMEREIASLRAENRELRTNRNQLK